jgi:hypothetical protein
MSTIEVVHRQIPYPISITNQTTMREFQQMVFEKTNVRAENQVQPFLTTF